MICTFGCLLDSPPSMVWPRSCLTGHGPNTTEWAPSSPPFSSSSSSSFSSTSRAGRLLWLSKTVSAKLALRLRLQLWQGIPVFLSPHHPLHWRTWTASFFRGDHYVLAKLKVQFFSEIKVLNDDILTVCSCWSQHPTLRKISAEISPQKIHGFGESFLDSLWWIFLRLTRSHLGLRIILTVCSCLPRPQHVRSALPGSAGRAVRPAREDLHHHHRSQASRGRPVPGGGQDPGLWSLRLISREEPKCEETPPVEMEDTQILDQSGPTSPAEIQRDQNSNAKVNTGAIYWLNEFTKSSTKPKKLDTEDISFPSTSSSSQKGEDPSSSKAEKRSRSSSAEGSSLTSLVTSRPKRAKEKKEQSRGICPICERSMKMTVLIGHAGEPVR